MSPDTAADEAVTSEVVQEVIPTNGTADTTMNSLGGQEDDVIMTVDGLSAIISDVMSLKMSNSGGSSVIPVNDIRALESVHYAKGEKFLRCKLASVYRLVDQHGWTQGIYNHITARVSQDTEHFLLNPFGLEYNEITASSLVKVNMQGELVEEGSTNFGVNKAGFMLHSAIHAARPDIKCIIHLHTPNIVAISTMKCGLMPLCQEACLIGDVSYHSYKGLVVTDDERDTLAKDLGPNNKVMFLRNHGVVCCGRTVEEAWYVAYHTMMAVDTQLKMMSAGIDNLFLIDEEARAHIYESGQAGGGKVDSNSGPGAKEWGVGEIEFESLMRIMDNAGYRTGYQYIQPMVRKETARQISDVEVPPTVSNLSYLLEDEDFGKEGGLRNLLLQLSRAATGSRKKSNWINSPNVYQKVEVLETGTTDPKKITKWVADGSPSHSNPIKIEKPNQFVPLNTNPKEFKKVQKAMKEGRRLGGVHAGPESRLLQDGVSWEEARQMQDTTDARFYPDSYEMKVGAASKGIIQRDFQHHATVYKSPYAKNPFDQVSAAELEEYKQIIRRKEMGELTPTSPSRDDTTTYGGAGDTTDPGEGLTSPAASTTVGQPFSPTIDTEPETERTYNEETDGNRTFSEGEGDTSRATDPESALSPKKEKKKKGLRTPSFLKKKKKDKKDKTPA